MQVHPLGTIGKLNALATTCTDVGHRRGWRCRRRPCRRRRPPRRARRPRGPDPPLRVSLRVRRRPPGWVSAMTQATGAQALARTAAIRASGLRLRRPRRLPGAHPAGPARRRGDGRPRPDRPLRHVLVQPADARAQRRGAVAHRRRPTSPASRTTRSPRGSPGAARASSRRVCRPSTPAPGRSTTSGAPRPTLTTTGSRRASPGRLHPGARPRLLPGGGAVRRYTEGAAEAGAAAPSGSARRGA